MPNILQRFKRLWYLSGTTEPEPIESPFLQGVIQSEKNYKPAQIIKRTPTIDEVIEKIINNG